MVWDKLNPYPCLFHKFHHLKSIKVMMHQFVKLYQCKYEITLKRNMKKVKRNMKRHFRIYSENINPPPILSLYYLLLFVIIFMYILVDLPFDNSEFAMTLKHFFSKYF